MTRIREIKDGVLLRPFESLATNFLSSRYYNGRHVVDLLEDQGSAHRWMDAVHTDLNGPAPFTPTVTQLTELRTNRAQIDALYKTLVTGTLTESDVTALNETLNMLPLVPQLQVRRIGDAAILALRNGDGTDESNVVASISMAAIDTVTGPRSRLLRKCHAPRCVLYFTQFDSRQHWCSNVCGNRARVARTAENHRLASTHPR
ncbi:ABATE domain-containing protein [Rhodococcus sp. 1168]|uniref:CGNR zinc finger domain-containing protein n=1 Tax=Rhodococcus sp. 1168 TaxID=2018041 RepID=UPI000A0DA745|nr:ABATE domain-containing protein [Rhodococcus sp. 1168]ORI23590.1 hypothetical protein BJI47_04015 [Rhodococcus sp. 1168]